MMKNPATQWYVITGGPSSGKTTMVNQLKSLGYQTTIEHARHYIDTQKVSGKTIAEMRQNQLDFQHGILDMQIEQEASLSPNETIFLDRAIPDALAYYRFLQLPEDEKLLTAVHRASYKKIFILAPLPLVKDYARTEDVAAQKEIHRLITAVYESLPAPVVHVPAMSLEERIAFVLKNL